ncbi:MAG TPA: Signal peptidase-like protein [Cytophagales bacterium]|nr:Signal peptidase-like protein [Cytophagales bacterium]
METAVAQKYDVVEVRFKSGRKDFYRNSNRLDLTTGDPVVVDVPNGHHMGYVSLQGELVRLQLKKKKVEDDNQIRSIYRIASQKDLEKYDMVRNREMPVLYRTREIIRDLSLEMKLTDIEFQADNTKATFFYSADDRVDFRELIKVLAAEFKIRVEMRQISLRQEAGRLGGIGSCGRELCCSTWLSDFKSVSTAAARYQNLSLNPSKLSGQCGRLKCCLNYELETYMDALEGIPTVQRPLQTEKGDAKLQKTDIFRKIMWFGFGDENTWHPISTERVVEILEMNERGEKPATLEDNEINLGSLDSINSDLESLDKRLKKRSQQAKKKKKSRRRNQDGAKGQANAANPPQKKGASSPKAEAGEAKEGEAKPKRSRNRNRNRGNRGEGNTKPKQDVQNKGENKPATKPRQKPKQEGSKKPASGENKPRRKRPNNRRRGGGGGGNNAKNDSGPKNDA